MQTMQRASALLQAGNYVLARTTLEQVLREAPRFVEAHRLLAGALQALGDAAGAERVLRAALALDPLFADAHANLAQLVWMRSGDINLALQELERAAVQQPGAEVLHLVRADLLDGAGETARADTLLSARAQRNDASVDVLL